MRFKIPAYTILFLISYSSFSIELSSGVIAKGRDTVRTEEQAKASVEMTRAIKDSSGYHGRSYGYTNLGAGSEWFRFYRNFSISGVDLASRKYLGNWPLTRWKHDYRSPLIHQQYSQYRPADIDSIKDLTRGSSVGCLGDVPLRYGDIENDGKNELVLTMGKVLLIFSPDFERIVFSEITKYNDLVSPSTFTAYFGDKTFEQAQYVSALAADNNYPIVPAMRYYSKVFQGDFNSNGKPDLIAWRKGYLSRRSDDPIKGFELKEESFAHYERNLDAQTNSKDGVTGEYLPQETDASTIQSWLADNELTWSKGYPSVSECEGREGQLIPEMHDPLLNDPDVLK